MQNIANSLFMCQDEDENETENKSVLLCVLDNACDERTKPLV